MPSNNRICFVHLPKCGGTSINRAIKQNTPWWYTKRYDSTKSVKEAKQRGVDLHQHREDELIKLLSSRYKYVLGHFRCSSRVVDQFQNWHFVTLLRNPVDRWLSHYFYNRFKEKSHFKVDASIDEYMESESGRANGSIYSRFLSSLKPEGSASTLGDVKNNLSNFSVVGTIENQEKFLSDFHSKTGRQIQIQNYNKNPAIESFRREMVTTEIRDRIEAICLPDIQIYEHAKTLH